LFEDAPIPQYYFQRLVIFGRLAQFALNIPAAVPRLFAILSDHCADSGCNALTLLNYPVQLFAWTHHSGSERGIVLLNWFNALVFVGLILVPLVTGQIVQLLKEFT